MAEYATINKINEKSIENDNQMELTNFDAIYNECVNYLKDENLNINFEKEPDYESIKEVEKGDISIEEEMNRDIINENKRNEENINEYNNNEVEKFEEEINDDDLNGEDSKEELSNTEQNEESFEEIINSNHAPKNQDQRIVPRTIYQIENELISESLTSIHSEGRSERLRKLSLQLPKIIITQSNSSLNVRAEEYRLKERNNMIDYKLEDRNRHILKTNSLKHFNETMHKTSVGSKFSNHGFFGNKSVNKNGKSHVGNYCKSNGPTRKSGYGDHPKRLVCKRGVENVALITNVPFERIRLLNDTFHTLINLRWRWIVTGTIVVHFAIWLVFAVFWYITAWAHYDFEPDAPARTCVTGGHDFLTIFLASVEAQTTIGFGDRAIDEECPESIFLFIMQLILGTGLSGVLTCVVYAKLTRPEKLSRDGVGFSKKAVISIRDGHLCLMVRAWDLNYDHIISSEFSAHFIHTHRTKEGEVLRYYAESLLLQQRQFLLWPVTLVHVIDRSSPLYRYSPDHIATSSYEITISLKGASASMGTFTQSQTSYLPKEVVWGHRFPPVVKYDARKQKYVIDHKKLDLIERIDTPFCSAYQLNTSSASSDKLDVSPTPGTPTSFSDQISSFQLGRSSSFRRKGTKT